MIRFARPEKLSEQRRIVYSRDDARVNRCPVPSDFKATDADGKTGEEHAGYKAAQETFLTEHKAYEANGFDPSTIAVKPGMRLTVFVAAPFQPSARGHLDMIRHMGQRIAETIAYGVVGVEDGEWTDAKGNVIPFAPAFENGAGGQRLAHNTLGVLMLDDGLRMELFVKILEFNAALHPEVVKSDPGT